MSTYKDLSGPIKRFVLRVHPDVMHAYGAGIASANEAVLQEVFIMLDIIRARAEAPESATSGPVANREALRQSYTLSFYLREEKEGKAGDAGLKSKAGAAAASDGLPPGVRQHTVVVKTPSLMGDRMALLAQRGMREQAQARYLQLGTRIVQQLLDAVGSPLHLTLGPKVAALLGRSGGVDDEEEEEEADDDAAAGEGGRPFDPSDPDAAAKAAHRRVRAMQRRARERERAVFADASSLMDAHLRGTSPLVQGKVDPETAAAAAAYAAAGGGGSGGFGGPGGAGGGASARFAAAMQAAAGHGPGASSPSSGGGRGGRPDNASVDALPSPAMSVFSPRARRARVLQLLARRDSVMEPLSAPGAAAGAGAGGQEGALTPALVRGAVSRLMALLIDQYDPLQVYEEAWMRVHFALLPPGGAYYADAANRTLHLPVDFNPHALLDFCRQRFVPALLDMARQHVARAADEQRRKAAAEARKRGRVVINPAAYAAPAGRAPKPGRYGPTSAGVGVGYRQPAAGRGRGGAAGGASDEEEGESDDEGDDAVIGPASRYVAGGRHADREAGSLDEALLRQWANPKGEYR